MYNSFLKKLAGVLLVASALSMAAGCFPRHQIRTSGLKGLALGKPMPEKNIMRLIGYPAHDSVIEEGGYTWRAYVVELPEGHVLVESDFFQQETINRIQVYAPALTFQKTIQVGSTVADLAPLKKPWTVTHLPDFERVNIAAGGLQFLISDHFLTEEQKQLPQIPLEQIPPNAPILGIVIM